MHTLKKPTVWPCLAGLSLTSLTGFRVYKCLHVVPARFHSESFVREKIKVICFCKTVLIISFPNKGTKNLSSLPQEILNPEPLEFTRREYAILIVIAKQNRLSI